MIPINYRRPEGAGPQPSQMRAVSDGAAYGLVLPQIREDFAQMVRAIQNQIFTMIRTKTLTPEIAYQAWMEVYSHEKLLKNMETRVKVGASTAEEITPFMNLTPPTGE